MNKGIIIDGVDVSKCPKYVTSEAFNLRIAMGENVCINCAGVECLFKKYELLKIQNQQQYIDFKNKEINYEEQIRQLRFLNKELQDCLKNDLTKLKQNQAVLNEIEKHLKNYLNMQNPAVNELNDGFNTGIKTVASLVLNIIEENKKLKNNEDLLISNLQLLWGKQIAEEQGDCKNIDYLKPRTREIYHRIAEIERTLKDVAFSQSVKIGKTKPLGDTGSPKSYKRRDARERKLLEREFFK